MTGDDIDKLLLLKSGTVTMYASYAQYPVTENCIIGLTDSCFGIACYSYVAETECEAIAIPFSSINDLVGIVKELENPVAIFEAAVNGILQLIKTYLSLSIKVRKDKPDFTPDARINKWELDYYNTLSTLNREIFTKYFSASSNLINAELNRLILFASSLHDACRVMADILHINKEYVPPVEEIPSVDNDITSLLGAEDFSDDDIYAILTSSFHKILAYCRYSGEKITEYRNRMNAFVNCNSKLATDDDTRQLRKSLTEIFYDIYYRAFLQSISDDNVPNYVKMFLHFGYLDERLVGKKNAAILFRLCDTIEGACNNSHVYTMYNWLKHIMWGEKTPSKNQFDQSYDEYIKEEQKNGRLPMGAENDTDLKLKYEINNMFRQVHRMTYGKASSFTPILIEENIMKPLDSIITTAETVMRIINYARNIDFSLFFRSSLYSNEKNNITKEYIYTEVLPNFILTPCLGTYGVMWQEIEGRDRSSSARFMLPIMCNANTEVLIYNILGKYRWEICKRIQGMYWNNLSEKSLTSEYYDYIQFYKKNKDLTDAIKDKIKSTLINVRNNYAEAFAKDYEHWIIYESKGINKLNKVSRLILSKYCPFNKNIRTELSANPAYTKSMEIYERQCQLQKHHFDLVIQSLEAKGLPVPKEIKETRAYFNK